jgi:hypothetical protein
MSRRGIQVLGLAAAGGVGYYLYNAGGDPKLAQKQAEGELFVRYASPATNTIQPMRRKPALRSSLRYRVVPRRLRRRPSHSPRKPKRS